MRQLTLRFINEFLFILVSLFTALLTFPGMTLAQEQSLPIVFVHGGAGSAAQYETQAMRFASNGYPNVVTGIDYNSLLPNSESLYQLVDAYFDSVMAETGNSQIYVVAHSRGTRLMVDYLNSSAQRSARVAKYINIDGATGNSCPGNPSPVNCLNISRGGSMGTNNVYLTDHGHTECVTSVQSFIAQYKFLTGKEPLTTIIIPEPPGQVEIAGRVVNFPENSGVDGAILEIWEVHGTSGIRKDIYPMAVLTLDSTGGFGPIKVNGQKYYEFAVKRLDSERITHYYRQPFIRSNYLIRLLSSPPTSGIIINTVVGPEHSAGVVIRYKEWWSDQGATNDTLWVTTKSPSWKNNPNYPPMLNILSNSGVAPRTANKIGIHVFDTDFGILEKKGDKVSSLNVIPYFFGQIFQSGVDIWMPATDPPDGVISFTNEPRGDGTKPQTINLPNWASDKHRISIQFNDYVQDINTWGECKRAKPSPCK